ncbi:MAG: phage portal protein [Bifidobacterium castoris]|nr:phage portal protein [Bifidobacterium castoris]
MTLIHPYSDWTSSSGMLVTAPVDVTGLDTDELALLDELIDVWNAKRVRNALKTQYADGKHKLEQIGFSIPPSMRSLQEVVGWPEKAVRAHAERCMFDGFVSKHDSQDPFDLRRLMAENNFDNEIPMAIASSMIHSCAFISVVKGNISDGEPPIVVTATSAEWAAGLWNPRKRCLRGGIVIHKKDDYASPISLTLFTPDKTIDLQRSNADGQWHVSGKPLVHGLHRVMMEVLAYRPTLDRPFGRSVISRPVMSITDDAVRTVLRSEVSAEFYSAPQWLLLGADPDSFTDDDGNPIPVWEFVIGRLNMIGKDEDGDVPKLEQISQQSVQPHIEQMRELACRFAGETSVPVSSLGVVTDNPSSAEAMHAAEKDLCVDCAAATRVYGAALRRVAQDMILLRDGPSNDQETIDEFASLSVRWRNPAMPSVIDAGDAMVKLIGAFPWLADTTVALEEVGFTDEQITRLLAEKRRNQAMGSLDQLLTPKEVPDARQDGSRPAGAGTEPDGGTRADGSGQTLGQPQGTGTEHAA